MIRAAILIVSALAVAPLAAAAQDQRSASLAAFAEMDRVLTSPRCQNCHTLTGFPRQGDDRHPHRLNVQRGPDGHGMAGLRCTTCHGRFNNVASGVPGADEDWHLAPLSMGWEDLNPSLRCAHLKDPAHNGGRTGSKVIDHLKTHLVTWAWTPGGDAHGRPRATPPMSYADFLHAAEQWVATEQACPNGER